MDDQKDFQRIRLPTSQGEIFIHPLEKLKKTNSSNITQILEKIQELKKITQALIKILPDPWIEHCQVANIRDTILILQADSSAWATRLHYQCPEILKYLQEHGWPTFTKIQVCIVLPNATPLPPPRRAVMSKISAEFLRNLSNTYPDEKFRALWARLASRYTEAQNTTVPD